MVNIYQNNAQIGQQFVADEMHFGAVQSPSDFAQALRKLQTEIRRAGAERALSEDQAEEALRHIAAALEQVQKEKADRPTLLSYLKDAKELVSGVGGLANAIQTAILAVGLLFP